MRCNLGVYEKAMPGTLTWREKLLAAGSAGFDFVEMSVDETDEKLARLAWAPEQRRELRTLAACLGTDIRTMCLSGHRRFPIGSHEKAVCQKGMSIMEAAVELAYDVGIRIIQVAGYDVYYHEISDESSKGYFTENLAKSADMAAARGVVLALETMENEFMNTIEKAMYYVTAINSPYLQIYPDIGNVTNGAADVAADIRSGTGHLVAAHLKETAPGIFRNMRYGEGHVDFEKAVGQLKAQGVRLFNAEFWYDGGRQYQEELKYSYDFLSRYLLQ